LSLLSKDRKDRSGRNATSFSVEQQNNMRTVVLP